MSHAIYCINGHYVGLVNPGMHGRVTMSQIQAAINVDRTERTARDFCTTCGARNISACESCHTPIDHKFPSQVHKYCAGCGKPFPWTEAALKAAAELADELDELNAEDKITLKGTFVDLTADTPRTQVAATRFKRIIKKVTSTTGEAIQKIIVDVASETALKLIKGS
jgi:hypothetical protein